MEYDDTRLLAETVRPNDEHTDDLLGSVVGMVERQINWEDYVRNGYTGKRREYTSSYGRLSQKTWDYRRCTKVKSHIWCTIVA